jgi:hypothetical protein
MSEIVLTLPNDRAGDIALNTIRNQGERRRDYRYLGDLAQRLHESRAAELLRELPMTLHLMSVQEGVEDAFARDLLGYHSQPDAREGERGFILAVEPDWAFSLCAPPGGAPSLRPDHGAYMSQMHVGDAHKNNNFGGSGHIAVIDTGSDGVAIDNYYDLLDPKTYQPGKANATDKVGHGTAMAMLIREVAPRCTLTVVRTTDTTTIPLWHLLAGIAIAVLDAQAEILNLSLGLSNLTGTCTKCGASATARGFALEYLMKSLRRLAGNWLPGGQPPTYVAATGNDGTGNGFFLPAKYDVSLAVGAVNKGGQLASFSTYGTYQHSNYVVAPGGEKVKAVATEYPISDTNDDYCGTSIAAAYTSGVLALLRTDNSSADLMQLASQKVISASPQSVCGKGQIEYS